MRVRQQALYALARIGAATPIEQLTPFLPAEFDPVMILLATQPTQARSLLLEWSRKDLTDHQWLVVHGLLATTKAPGQAAELLKPVYRVIREDLQRGSYLQADETPIRYLDPDVKGKSQQGYLWTYSRPGGDVLFDGGDGGDVGVAVEGTGPIFGLRAAPMSSRKRGIVDLLETCEGALPFVGDAHRPPAIAVQHRRIVGHFR